MRGLVHRLVFVSADAEGFFRGPVPRCVGRRPVRSLAHLFGLLQRTARPAGGATTLDLIGHSTYAARLLRLGTDVIDMFDPWVSAGFRDFAESGRLRQSGVSAVRLLGCETAVTPTARRSMGMLAHVLGMPVVGTRRPLLQSHYDRDGFDPVFQDILVEVGPPGRVR